MKLTGFAALAALGFSLSGFATIVQGTTETVSVKTIPVKGARCSLRNSQGTWYLRTPGSVTVHKTKTNLHINCNAPGFAPGRVVATSHFGGTTAGNVLAGGVIGLAVDAASGANYYYDSPITVPLGPQEDASAAPPPKAMAANGQPTS